MISKKYLLNRFSFHLTALFALISFQLMGQTVDLNPQWTVTPKLIENGAPGTYSSVSVKDPSVVYSGGAYHVFHTGFDNNAGCNIGYVAAPSLEQLGVATQYPIEVNGGSYNCAPQVLWFEPQQQWYLIYQMGSTPGFSTNSDITNPNGWTNATSMGFNNAIDYWVIRDGNTMYIFYSIQGERSIGLRSTSVDDFPFGWGPETTVVTNVFEASHIYKNLADGKFYMIVEQLANPRYQELWGADQLSGPWSQLEARWMHNNDLTFEADVWTNEVSHVEAIRYNPDEYMQINDFNNIEIMFQGVLPGNYPDYSSIPYDLGVARNGSGNSVVQVSMVTNDMVVEAPADINIEANVSDVDAVSTLMFMANGEQIGVTEYVAPYAQTITFDEPGTYEVTAVVTLADGGQVISNAATITVNVPQGPYGGTPHAIPGTIQLEDFDEGGNGFAYYDDSDGSETGVNFRTDTDVDIEESTDQGGGYNLGYTTAGEWVEYTVDVQQAGSYSIDLRVASNGAGKTLSLTMDGTTIAENVAIPNTQGWQTWQTVTINDVALQAGEQIMRLTIGPTDYINLNYITFTNSSTVVDTDNDGTPDNADACPNDPNKAASAGECGCGVAEGTCSGQGNPNGTMYVDGRDIYTACGEKVVFRGVNEMFVWSGNRTGSTILPEIAETGANAVRLVWLADGTGSVNEFRDLIENCIANDMIAVPELHDATGDFSQFQSLLNYWTQPAVVQLMNDNKEWVILNIGNEVGNGSETNAQFQGYYESAITQLRNAGYQMPLMIDAGSWGNNENYITSTAAALMEHDPLHNLIFSVHTYWIGSQTANQNRLDALISNMKSQNLPLSFGEAPQYASSPSMCTQVFPYEYFLQRCEEEGLGWLAWSWGAVDNSDCGAPNSVFDITTNGQFGSWSATFGEQLCVTNQYSIMNTSVRPASLVTGNCSTQGSSPTVSITAPANGSSYDVSSSILIEATASDADGSVISLAFYVNGNLISTDNSSPYTATWTPTNAGTYSLTVVATDNDDNQTTSAAVSIDITVPQGPFGGTVWPIPGIVQAEDYDVGGQGVAFNDNEVANQGGATYRDGDGVDIETTGDTDGNYNVGYIRNGEWLEYTVDVASTGLYDVELRMAKDGAGGLLHIEMNGNDVTGQITVPNTGGWQTWQTLTLNDIELQAGEQIMRIAFDSDYMNLNYVVFSAVVQDADNDGTPDNEDACPQDPNKAAIAGACGCGVADTDTDADGIADCNDAYPMDFDNDGIPTAEDCDDHNPDLGLLSTWYADADDDGVGSATTTLEACTQPQGYVATAGDECPNDDNKTTPGNCGCGVTEQSCLDCAGIPNGTTVVDDCGVCGGTNACVDCAGTPFGTAVFDDCGVCNGTNACVDCAGTPNGNAFIDNCNECVGGNSGLTPCTQDCNGEWGGTATFDACNECTGGNTGFEPITDPQLCIATGLNDSREFEFHVYPNPTSGMLYLKQKMNWVMLNTFGEKVLNGNSNWIDMSSLSKGIYLLKAHDQLVKVVRE